MKQFARPPPDGVHRFEYPAWEGVQQLPDEVLRSKLEKLTLTQYPSVAFREMWTWTCDSYGDRRNAISFRCEPITPLIPLDERHAAGLLDWLAREYVPHRLGRTFSLSGVLPRLPRSKHGVRSLDAAGNFGDWRRQAETAAIELRFDVPTIGNVSNTTFAREMNDELQQSRGMVSYRPGDTIEVHYREPRRHAGYSRKV